MKQLAIIVIGVGLLGGVVALLNNGNTVEVTNTEIERVEIEKPVEVIDPIDKARAELERINQELDLAEQEGIAKREAVEAAYQAKLAELKAEHESSLGVIDTELDRIRETRTGF